VSQDDEETKKFEDEDSDDFKEEDSDQKDDDGLSDVRWIGGSRW
jgi:hypothetical protein